MSGSGGLSQPQTWGCPTGITTKAALAGSMQVAVAEPRLAIQQLPRSPVLLFGVLAELGMVATHSPMAFSVLGRSWLWQRHRIQAATTACCYGH